MSAPVADSVLGLIGRTPLIHLAALGGPDNGSSDINAGGGARSKAKTESSDPNLAAIFGKLEAANPGGSVKDRICWAMINAAERDGLLSPDNPATIIEPTSGNTGIGLALVCSAKGYKLILTMPEDMSTERRALLKSYGAELYLTPAEEGMKGSVDKAEELCTLTDNCFMPQQFNNPANPEVHRDTTAPEIIEALGDRKVDALVAGVGTGGTITGVGEVLKEKFPDIKIVAVEPSGSAVLSGGRPGMHRIQGLGAGFVPSILNREIIDEVLAVTDEEAYDIMHRLAKEEGLLVGISSGANVFAARKIAKELGPGKNVVTVLCDTGERYFSLEKTFE